MHAAHASYRLLSISRYLLVCAALLTSEYATAQELRVEVAGQTAAEAADEARLREALQQQVDLSYFDDTLAQVVENIEAWQPVEIEIDTAALNAAGLSTDISITRELQGISLDSALSLLLVEHKLAYTLRDGKILISTPVGLNNDLSTRTYYCAPLLAGPDRGTFLIEAITSTIAPIQWDDVGGAGEIQVNDEGTALVISQTLANHELLEDLLRQLLVLHANLESPNPADEIQVHLVGQTPAERVAEMALQRALASDTDLSFFDDALLDVTYFLRDYHNISIAIDTAALDEVGLNSDIAITCELRNLTLASALNIILAHHKLTYDTRYESLLITTPDEQEDHLQTRIYAGLPLQENVAECADCVIELLTCTLAPLSWDEVGGPGSICHLEEPGVLVVSQTRQVHEQIESLLNHLYATLPAANQNDIYFGWVGSEKTAQRELAILAELEQPTEYSFFEDPLADVAMFFESMHGLQIEIDEQALDDVGLSANIPLTAEGKHDSLRAGLAAILEPHELTWTIRNEVLLITTYEEFEWPAQVVVFRGGVLDDLGEWDFDGIIESITNEIAPHTWDEVGGIGSIVGYNNITADANANCLVLYQTPETLRRIREWLREYEPSVERADPARRRPAGPAFPPGPAFPA